MMAVKTDDSSRYHILRNLKITIIAFQCEGVYVMA
jgi:hypothetical protein